MKKLSFWFSLVYCIYLLQIFIDPDVFFKGLPIRQVLTVGLLFMCFLFRQKQTDWFLIFYVLFLFGYLLAGLSAGFGNEALMKLLGTYFVSCVLYKATTIMVKRLNQLNLVSIVLMIVFVVDAIVTIGQYYQVPFFMMLPQQLGIQLKDSLETRFYDSVDLEGVQIPGIVGPVINGYLLSAATILSWYSFHEKQPLIINVIIWGVCLIASYLSQERAGFFLALVFSLYVVFTRFYTKKGYWRFLSFLLIMGLLVFAEKILTQISNMGRYSMGIEAQDRLDMFDYSLAFIKDHPWGSIDLYTTQQHMPHNLIANMFIAGGWFGGAILLSVVLYQVYKCLMFIFHSNKNVDWLPLLYVLSYLNITAQSFVHNYSIVYGSALFFVFWGVVSCFIVNNTTHKLNHML